MPDEDFILPNDILATLRLWGELSRTEICILLKRPRTTILDHLERLEMKNKVRREKAKPTSKRGRPTILWFLEEDV